MTSFRNCSISPRLLLLLCVITYLPNLFIFSDLHSEGPCTTFVVAESCPHCHKFYDVQQGVFLPKFIKIVQDQVILLQLFFVIIAIYLYLFTSVGC